ncbi:spore coat protein YsxE [Halalkalibacter akibai]|uniref:CotS-related protein n=1 Tax=Halalkalibacter akibai (strain ATCC 43226 / DSM 21942 / CIP 109018 / JCM 9157 / 1139) TaxID=1236973 RepID=W4QUE7_HALA3|nr:spore coat protein YsxE [Halalkalibacter akibai]GAE34934.1 CotS-related protein [Halalkalibacter akibai JCM 9157]
MMQAQSPYDSVLFYYDLYPQAIEDFGKIKKVTTNRGVFALKETRMSPEQADSFIHALRKLTKLGYTQTVPVYPTKYGEYVLQTGDYAYYLMPWVEPIEYTARETQEQKLASQLGIIHRLTVKTQPFLKENVEESYQQLLRRWEMRRLELSRFADQAERKTYMSPFELTFITHAHMLDQMAEVAKGHLEKWFELCLEKEKYRTVLCHSRMNRTHSFFSPENEPLLLNFERACVDTPSRDIASFCRYSFRHAYWVEEEVLQWFHNYESHLPLLEEEKHLICAYLNFPEPIAFAVDAYLENRGTAGEFGHVQRLEKRLTSMRRVQRLTQKLIIVPDPQQQTQTPQ